MFFSLFDISCGVRFDIIHLISSVYLSVIDDAFCHEILCALHSATDVSIVVTRYCSLQSNGIVRKSCKQRVNAKQVLKSGENFEYEFMNWYKRSSFLLSNSCNAVELKRYDWILVDSKSSEKTFEKSSGMDLHVLPKLNTHRAGIY